MLFYFPAYRPTLKWVHKYLIGLSAQEGIVKQAPVYLNLFLRTKICKFEHEH